MKTPTPQNPLAKTGDGNHHHKTFLRQIVVAWHPETPGDAKCVLEECLADAEGLSSVLTQYCWDSAANGEDLRFALQVLDDLLYLAYSMLEHWPEEKDLIEDGWTPPKTREVLGHPETTICEDRP